MRKSLIGALVVTAATSLSFLGSRHPVLNTPTRVLASSESAVEAAGSPHSDIFKSPHFIRSFAFQRGIHVGAGSETVVDLNISGNLWLVPQQTGDDRKLWVKLEAPADLAGSPVIQVTFKPTLEIIRVDLGARSKSLVKSVQKNEMLGRIAIDVAEQFLFFKRSDLQGSFQAHFVKLDSEHYRKTKVRYLNEPYSKAEVRNSVHLLTLDERGESREIRGAEEIDLGTGNLAFASSTDYLIERREIPIPLVIESDWNSVSLTSVQSFDQDEQGEQDKDDEQADGTSSPHVGLPAMEMLLSSLQATLPKDRGLRLDLFKKLIKRLDTDPASAQLARTALAELQARPEQLGTLVGALAASTSANAQRVLEDAYRPSSEGFSENRDLILNAWIGTEAPLIPSTLSLLKESANRDDSTLAENQGALLAVGAQISRQTHSAQRRELESFLISKLEHALLEAGKVVALDAIGNSGSPSFLPYLRDFLSDPSQRVRSHAYLALRKIPGDEVLRVIENGHQDPSLEVRNSVQLALSLRDGNSEIQ